MNKDRLNQLEEITFGVTIVFAFSIFALWVIGMIFKLILFLSS